MFRSRKEINMTTITQPLRNEHKELMPHVETLQLAGDSIHEALTVSDRALIDKAYTFLTQHLIPHAHAEEKALYPVVRKVMGADEGTATMSRDHIEVERLTKELEMLRSQTSQAKITTQQANSLRRVLYGLYALVKVHFAKEEEIYLPLLDSHLKPEEAKAMLSAMEAAAQEAKAQLH
jgi:hemerythrin-like domain-containing protein